jgi:hypothetical protein
MASKEEIRRVSIYINGNESELTLKQLTQGSAKLKNELAGLTVGTEEFKKKAEELRQVRTVLNEVRGDIDGVGGAFGKVKDGIGDLKSTIIGAFSVGAAVEGIKALIVQNAALSDSLADVQKTTGLTQASARHLNEDLKKIDTRTAQDELLGLAKVAGKLGISAENDVFAFVKAADQINVALGEDLGGAEEAINSLGKLTDIFKIKDQYGLEQSLLKTGSAINELGAAGTANEGYLVSFAGRMAGIAPAANISLQNVLGLAAVMDELQQPVEASATAIGQFVVGLGKDIPRFAAIARMSIKDFSTLLNTDGNAALIRVLSNVQSTGKGVEGLAANMGMVGEDGARAVTALGALSNNLDLLKKRQELSNQEFEKGTSLTSEFNVKNNNLAATLDKIGKWFSNMATTGVIQDIVTSAVDGFAKWAGIIKPLSTDLEENKVKLLALRIELESNNTTSARRVEILTQLKSEYPGYLGQIDTERTKNSDLLPILEKINEQYILRIAYQKRMEKLDEAVKNEAQSINDVYDARQKLVLGIAKVQEELANDGIKFTIKGANEQEKAYYIYKNLNKELKNQAKTNNDIDKIIGSNKYDYLVGNLNQYGNALKSNTEDLNDYKKTRLELEKEASNFKSSAGDLGQAKTSTDKPKTPTTKPGTSPVVNTLDGLKKRLEDLRKERDFAIIGSKEYLSLQKQIAETEKKVSAIEHPNKGAKKQENQAEKAKKLFNDAEQERIASLERTAQAIMDTYAKELSDVDEHFRKLQFKHRTNSAAVRQIEQERVAKLKQIEEKFRKEDLAKLTSIQNEISQLATAAITRDTDRQLAELDQATTLKLQQLDKEDTELKEKVKKQQDSIANLKKSGKNDEAAILEGAVARELDILDKSGKLREQFLKNQGAKEAQIVKSAANNKRLSELEAEVINADSENPHSEGAINAHLALLEEKHRLEVENAELTGQDVAAINARYEADKKALTEQRANETKAFLVQMAQEATSSIFSIMANNRQAQLDASLSNIETEREKELSNKTLTEQQKKVINDKYDAQVKAEKLKAWKSEQRAAISQAIINGAIGITAAWKNPLAAPFTIPLIIGTTAAQVAVIATQEPPKYEQGGYSAVDYTTEDRTSPSGFVRRPTLFSNSSSGRPFIAGENYKTEYIVSSDQLKDPVIADFVGAIEGIRGVKRFEYGGYSNEQSQPSAVSSTVVQQSPGMNLNTKVLEDKMDQFILAANDAWNYRIFEERQKAILEAREDASA